MSVVRVWPSIDGLSAHSHEHLRRWAAGRRCISDADASVVVEAEDTSASIDLLSTGTRPELDLAAAREFVLRSTADQRGLLSDADGVVLSEVSRQAFLRFLQPRGPQDDEPVYRHAALTRQRHEEQGGQVALPRQVYLGLTQHCDRSCTFCVSRTFDYDLLSLAEIDRLADQLNGDVDVIALTGTGEAMTHPQFFEALDLLCDRFPTARYKMNTSGLSLVRRSEQLLRYPIKNITVSLNATTPETYERFVGKGLAAVLKGIRTLVEARVRCGRDDLRLCLSMVLMNSTLPELHDMAVLAFQLGVEEIQGITLMLNDPSLLHESTWFQQDAANRWLDAAERQASRLGVDASLPPRYGRRSQSTSHQPASLPVTQGHRCTEVYSTIYVRPNGEISPCPYFDRTAGSTREESLQSIWQGPEYQRIRRGLTEGPLLEQCQHCCGFSEGGSVEDYQSHWLGVRGRCRPLPMAQVGS